MEFTSETEHGWQQAMFSSPVPIQPNTTYVISYRATAGFYAVDRPYFTADLVRGPLSAPQNGGPYGFNGVFIYDFQGGEFPNRGTLAPDPGHSPNYWVDVVFYAD